MPSISSQNAESRRRVERMQALSKSLDSKFTIPGIGVPVGWDSILGLIPGIGDLVTLGPGLAMMAEGYRMGARKRALARMGWNTGVDVALGTVPLVGDIFDLFFKSHRKNATILMSELERIEAQAAEYHGDTERAQRV